MSLILLILSFFPAHAAESLDALVVSATRSETPALFVPNAVSTVTGEELRARGDKIDEILRSVPGVAITQNGGPGQTRSLLIRGAKAEHTLVLVDGVPANDPLSPSRNFDFGQIPVDEIERIEVLRGPQSVLYGSDAIGGVVQIFTKKDAEARRVRLEAGSFGTARATLLANGFHGSFERSDGFSAADEAEGNRERDGFRAWRLGGRRDFSLGESTRWGVQGQYADTKTDTDAAGGRGGDSTGTLNRQTQLLFRSDATHFDANEIEWNGALSIQARNRDDNTSGPSFFRASLWKAETNARKALGDHELTAGAEYQEERGRGTGLATRRRAGIGGLFVQEHYKGARIHGTLGARLDRHERHGNARTARAALGYWVAPGHMRLKGSVGTGFKAPSLFQLFSSFGDASLAPERSLGWDAGLEVGRGIWSWELYWYQNRFRDLIDFDTAASRYRNTGLASSAGIETELRISPAPWSWSASFTTIRSRDRNTGLRLLRRPAFSLSSELGWNPEPLRLALHAQWTGPRDDSDPVSFARKRMPSFAIFGLTGSHRLSARWALDARIDNLLDREYQESAGYGTPGLSAYAGLRAEL